MERVVNYRILTIQLPVCYIKEGAFYSLEGARGPNFRKPKKSLYLKNYSVLSKDKNRLLVESKGTKPRLCAVNKGWLKIDCKLLRMNLFLTFKFKQGSRGQTSFKVVFYNGADSNFTKNQQTWELTLGENDPKAPPHLSSIQLFPTMG